MADFHPLPSLTTTYSDAFDALNKDAEKRAKECMPASMPSLDHLTMKDYENVYEPSDDTFLLLDGIQLGFELNDKGMKVDSFTALEIGCGTGIPIVYLGLQHKQLCVQQQQLAPCNDAVGNSKTGTMTLLATDCNPHALRVAQSTAAIHSLSLTTYQCDLASALLSSTKEPNSPCTSWDGAIDMLLFNPPYVPTPDEEVADFSGKHNSTAMSDDNHVGIEASWAGGLHGRRVIDRAVPQIGQLLRKTTGVAYMITVDDNLPEQLRNELCKLGLRMEPWVRRRARNEYLTVQRITWM